MQIRYTGQNIKITQAIREYTEKKLHRIENQKEKITDVHLVFSIEKLNQIVEGTILVSGGHIHAKASSEDMYESIDKVADRLISQLVKYKEKINNHNHSKKEKITDFIEIEDINTQ